MKPTASLTLDGTWVECELDKPRVIRSHVTHLVVDLEDLVILPEPSPLALTPRHDLGDKHANLRIRTWSGHYILSGIPHLILSVAIQTSVDQGQPKTLMQI